MNKKKYLAIIPARKNSKRLKNKNLLKINNKSLINYTLDAAKKVKKLDKIIITTDIEKIIKKNTKKIFYIRRPNYLCKDNCSTESAIIHALKFLNKFDNREYENLVLLQPTSPFRGFEDINKAILTYEKNKYDSLLSVLKEKMSLWKKKGAKAYPTSYQIGRRIRGQFMNKTIIENGAIYIFKIKSFVKFKNRLFGKIGFYEMTKKNSLEIDNLEDLKIARLLINLK